MAIELKVPPVGESITEVQIGDWLKKAGDAVAKDENVVLIESEKATLELPAPAAGVLGKILKARGEAAKVGEVIGLIEDGAPASGPASSSAAPAEAKAAARSAEARPAAKSEPVVMPAAQRVLAEAGVAAADVKGTGPGGRVLKEDAIKAAEAAKAPAAPAPSAPPAAPASSTAGPRADEVVPMSPLRRTVARRLVEAQASMAMLTTFNEVDMSAVMALRKQFQEAFTAKHGVKLGFMSFFVKAVIDALKAVPQVNAEIQGSNLVFHHYYDIGVAVGGGKGLVVPVVRSADRLSFAELEKTIAELGGRAKDGKIKPEELQGGTFTISNGGVYGSLLSTPIINPPQSGILGMHGIQDRPVAVEGQVVIRPMMYVALTYDHRVVDGREAVTFLKRVKEVVENPARMLIEA
ncbi:MAG: 2-oxoglutarate dehydrogenase complex dihydrolipoyllysine-residue succinyltransferase [Limisphaerales bacterium]